MSALERTGRILPVLCLFSLAVRAQQPYRVDWAFYQAVTPILKGTVDELARDGLTPLFDSTKIQDFKVLFTAAVIPVRASRGAPSTPTRTFAILVLFARVPMVTDPPIVQVVRLDFTDRPQSGSVDIEGRNAIVGKEGFRFSERVLLLVLDREGRVHEEINNLVFKQVARDVSVDCIDLAMKAVEDKCSRYSEVARITCKFLGWLWSKNACSEIRVEEPDNRRGGLMRQP